MSITYNGSPTTVLLNQEGWWKRSGEIQKVEGPTRALAQSTRVVPLRPPQPLARIFSAYHAFSDRDKADLDLPWTFNRPIVLPNRASCLRPTCFKSEISHAPQTTEYPGASAKA